MFFVALLSAVSACADAIYTFRMDDFSGRNPPCRQWGFHGCLAFEESSFAGPATSCQSSHDCTSTVGLTSSSSISGRVDLASPLPADGEYHPVIPLSWTFTDGVTTITNTNGFWASGAQGFSLQLDSTGAVRDWFFAIGTVTKNYKVIFISTPGLVSGCSGPLGVGVTDCYFDLSGNLLVSAFSYNVFPNWAETNTSTPELTSFAQAVVGILFGAASLRRKHQPTKGSSCTSASEGCL